MTIFDTLKYPISNPPTRQEINNVPDVIITEWISICHAKFKNVYKEGYMFFSDYPPAAELLRRIILEWNDDNI